MIKYFKNIIIKNNKFVFVVIFIAILKSKNLNSFNYFLPIQMYLIIKKRRYDAVDQDSFFYK